MPDLDRLDEREQEELIVALEQAVDRDRKRGHATYWNADNATQDCMEFDSVSKWATEMNRRGWDIEIPSIRKNPEVYPDCLATVSGETIGVEVTELVDSETIRANAKSCRSTTLILNGLEFPNLLVPIWHVCDFREKLEEIIQRKDARVRDSSLAKQLLLIVTDEPWLDEATVAEYLDALTLKRPRHFDEVYIMLSYVPDSTGNGHHPVFRIPLLG